MPFVNRTSLTGPVNSTATIGMGHAHVSAEWVLHISGTFVGTIQPKVWVPGGGLTIADRTAAAYKVRKTGVLTDPTATGITTVGVYIVPVSAGEILVLEFTAYTSGTAVIDPVPSPLS